MSTVRSLRLGVVCLALTFLCVLPVNASAVIVVDEPPTAAIIITAAVALAGQPTSMDATASSDPDGSIVSYAWSFGDGATATGRAVSHAYANPGTYSIRLTVRDSGGASATTTRTVTIHAEPQSTFTFAPALPRELSTTTFDGSASVSGDGNPSISSYRWSFGDGASATGATVTHSYARAGTYMVTLAVTNNLGLTDTTDEVVTVAHALPTAAIAVRPAEPVRGQPVRFSGSAGHAADEPSVSYVWRFGDGSSAAGRAPSHPYSRAGRYLVSLTVSDSFGDSTTATMPVVVTRHGVITSVAARLGRRGATLLVSVNGPGALSTGRWTRSIKTAGKAAITLNLTRAQLQTLRGGHRLDIRIALRFRPRGGAPSTSTVVVSLRRSSAVSGYAAAIHTRRP